MLDPSTGSTLLEHFQAQRNKGQKYIFGTNNPSHICSKEIGVVVVVVFYCVLFWGVFGFFLKNKYMNRGKRVFI